MMIAWIVALALTAEPIAGTIQGSATTAPAESQDSKDVQAITQLLNDQYAAWNRHDIDAYLAPFWQSPRLVYVAEGQVCFGWQEVRATMIRNYPDLNSMGTAIPERIHVDLLNGDSATTVEWWTVRMKGANVHGISTSSWKKIQEGWRIVEVQSSSFDSAN